ncbi:MAG: O-antigen ligase family protein, partial [Gemmataceae bacterium]
LGLLQGFSRDKTNTLWESSEGKPFGPFVNKNHFAFQINLCIGLAGGLFVSVMHRRRGWRSPLALGVLGGIGVMVTALGFSESRGGVLAAIASAVVVGSGAWLRQRDQKQKAETKAGLVLALGVVVVAGLMTAWLGVHTVVDRMGTLFGDKADNRTADWRSVWPLVERFPLAGVGGGALVWAEPTIRTRSDIGYVFNTMDNEYLEALVEGGLPRFLLTLGLGVAAVSVAIRGYRRTGDPLLLGCAFGLLAIAIHSAGDFGLHTGSVAITAAVVAAFATARGREPTTHSRDREGRVDRGEWVFTGGWVPAIAALLVVASLAVVLTEWRLYREVKLREAAALVLRVGSPAHRESAIRTLEAVTRIRPNDPAAWELLMGAHLVAATDQQRTFTASVAGGVVIASPKEIVPSGDPDGHLSAALRTARKLRECQPLSAAAHITLGTYAEAFARSEPSGVHFSRAKRVSAFNPDVWYFSGRAAAMRGDWSAAAADWRESLKRSQTRLRAIVSEAKSRFSPEELRANVLPDEPAVWFAATPYLFPEVNADREAWLRAAAERWAARPEPTRLPELVDWGTTLELLGDQSGATRLWWRAVERFPDEIVARDRLAAALAAEELYEDAVPVLEWLLAKQPENAGYRERMAAAKHWIKLKAEINRD